MFKRLKLADYSTSTEPCSCCRANTSNRPWADWREHGSAWIDSIWTATEYSNVHPDRHPLLRLVLGVNIASYIPDIMHCKNLGSDSVYLGRILRYLTHYFLPDSPDMNLRTLLAEIKHEYGNLNLTSSRYTRLTHHMIHPPSKRPAAIERESRGNHASQ